MSKCHVSKDTWKIFSRRCHHNHNIGSRPSIMQEKQLDVLILKLTYCDAITRTVTVKHGSILTTTTIQTKRRDDLAQT